MGAGRKAPVADTVRHDFWLQFGHGVEASVATSLPFLALEHAFPSANAVSFEDFRLWLLFEYLRPEHRDVAHQEWRGMCMELAPRERLEHDTKVFNSLLLREDFMMGSTVAGSGTDSCPRLHDDHLRRVC